MDLKKYKSTIGIERLKSFDFDCNVNEKFLIEAYQINIQISQAFYPILSLIEIHLRRYYVNYDF